jgi:acyl-CoA thioesterase
MKFSEVMQGMQGSGGDWALVVGDDWMTGRTAFGGLQAAIAVRAMRGALGHAAPLRTLQIAFIGPVPAGPLQVHARVLRAGKNATQLEARLMQGGEALALAIGIFGAKRPSVLERLPLKAAPPPGEPLAFQYVPGVFPTFLQHFRVRWLRGSPPFTGSTSSEIMVGMDLVDSARSASEGHALAIADMIPPIALTMLKQPAHGGTMTWMIEFLADRFDHLALTNWRVDGELLAARDGYTSQAATVWGPDGTPVAFSQQSMVVFA